jgi:hypothetical protein
MLALSKIIFKQIFFNHVNGFVSSDKDLDAELKQVLLLLADG